MCFGCDALYPISGIHSVMYCKSMMGYVTQML